MIGRLREALRTLRWRCKAALDAFRDPHKVEDGVILRQVLYSLCSKREMVILTAERHDTGFLPLFHMLDRKTQHEISNYTGIRPS